MDLATTQKANIVTIAAAIVVVAQMFFQVDLVPGNVEMYVSLGLLLLNPILSYFGIHKVGATTLLGGAK